ncbi:MAG: MBL fold metallo-hydrolase [Deltaproteobacteria bacterium]|nr:MBL fold metallo-hydrolase [Deltaproteobacteria bacterium]
MRLTFLGAAQTVTGSMHMVETEGRRILLDCGMFQGRRRESNERNRTLPFSAKKLDALILSHAHIDHSGSIPTLMKAGFEGTIFATPATRDLCAVMLRDAAFIQTQDAGYINRYNEKHGIPDRVEPIYEEKDAIKAFEHFISVPYRRSFPVIDGVTCTMLDAGHVLGSAIVVLDVKEQKRKIRLVFTGDLGRVKMPILNDPETPAGTQVLITESTYGDRLHDPIEEMDQKLLDVVKRTVARGGKVIVPSFALERAQEIIFALRRLQAHRELPRIPIYVDSPLTVKITDIFKLHSESFDPEIRGFMADEGDPFAFADLRYVDSVEDSRKLNVLDGPAMIISASGMCEAGRILHHLNNHIEDRRNTILIVGFQAEHTLGRRIVERRQTVKIFGVAREVNAEVVVLHGFSAHADRDDLLRFGRACRERGSVEQVVLVHGEPEPQQKLAGLFGDNGFPRVAIPKTKETLEIA